ncbi:MAG: MerR family DNA-binding transcriptional regulator [Myxococcaceae bacterium]
MTIGAELVSCGGDQGCITFSFMASRQTVPASTLLTIKAAAEVLGVSEQTLRRWDAAGKFPAKRHPMNGYRLYPKDAIVALRRRIQSGAGIAP